MNVVVLPVFLIHSNISDDGSDDVTNTFLAGRSILISSTPWK